MTGDLPVINSYNSEYEGEFSPGSPNKNASSADSRNGIQHEIFKAKSHKTDEMLEQSHDYYYPNQHHINIDFKNQITKKRSSQVITLDKYKGESVKSSQDKMTHMA